MKNRTICNLLAFSITLAILASVVAIGANTNASTQQDAAAMLRFCSIQLTAMRLTRQQSSIYGR